MWVFSLLNLFLLHEVVIKLLYMFASHLVFISFCFLTSWFLNTVHCVLLLPDEVRPMKRTKRRVEFFFNKYITHSVFVEVLLASDSTRRTNEF